jgi:uncharacterized membrane protein YphA (DoxX/SURF4 family)
MEIAIIQNIVLLLVRIMLGVVLLYFGIPKIKDLKQNGKNFVAMGFKPGMLWGTIVAFLEVVGAVLIILGVFAWIPAGLLAIQMLVGAIWKIWWTPKKFPDWSYDLLLFLVLLIVFFIGSGFFTIWPLILG